MNVRWAPFSGIQQRGGQLLRRRRLGRGHAEGCPEELLAGGAYTEDTPAALVYKATWPDERVFRCTVGTLAETARENQITKTALITVGGFLGADYARSKLYDPSFTTEFREASQ